MPEGLKGFVVSHSINLDGVDLYYGMNEVDNQPYTIDVTVKIFVRGRVAPQAVLERVKRMKYPIPDSDPATQMQVELKEVEEE